MNMKVDWREGLIKALIVLCGMTAATLFIVRGDGEVLPLLAVGGVLGATLVSRFVEDKTDEA